MRIVVHGQQAFGKSVLEALLEKGEDVVAVYCAPDKEGRPVDAIKELALEQKLTVYQPSSYSDDSVCDELRSLSPDLVVMAYVTLFVREEFLNIPTHGTIQYHPSLLPLHRGPSSINWPIIQGSKKTGLSIFWPDNGLDTGPILMQKEVNIEDDDTLGSLYFNKLFPLGVEAMLESVDLVRDGNAPKIVQDESQATYESWCKKEDVEINWSVPTEETYNLIRGANPQPGAWTVHGGQTFKIFDCVKFPGVTGSPGEILSIDDEGLVVATGDGGICIQRVRPEGAGKMSVQEYISTHQLEVGTRLG
ncbi:MAG: methionyl-tRNA formyltransferase [Gemmatimonadetes bacterium]|nr:methionyl-tRNA formyltransferase [Gemmatimonadota bacterium]